MRGDVPGEPGVGSIFAEITALEGESTATRTQVVNGFHDDVQVIRVNTVDNLGADQFVGSPSEHRLPVRISPGQVAAEAGTPVHGGNGVRCETLVGMDGGCHGAVYEVEG